MRGWPPGTGPAVRSGAIWVASLSCTQPSPTGFSGTATTWATSAKPRPAGSTVAQSRSFQVLTGPSASKSKPNRIR